MKTKKVANGILVCFLTIMLLLTLFAEDLYRLTWPRVVTDTVEQRTFPYETTGIDGSTVTTDVIGLAIPWKALEDGNRVFVLVETEDGAFIREQEVQIGKKRGSWIEVTEGVTEKAKLVTACDRELKDGDNVLVVTGGKQLIVHELRRAKMENVRSEYLVQALKQNSEYGVNLLAMTVIVIILSKRLLTKKLRFLQVPVFILWCVAAGMFLRENIVIPSEWIPDKLIDFNGWKENIRQFTI